MSLLKKATTLTLAAPAAWVSYSKFGIDRAIALPPALEAEIQVATLPQVGRVAYYHDDSGSGKPIVLVHSINAAASAREMQPLFEHYRGRRPIYALDLPGYGHSSRDERNYTPELFAGALVDFIREVVRASVDVIALSLGCEFATRAAVAAPDWFASLVLISPTGFTGAEDVGRSEQASRSGDSSRAFRLLSFPLWSQGLYDLIATKRSIRFFLQKSFRDQEPPAKLIDYAYKTAHQPNAKNVPLHFLSGRLFTRGIAQSIYPQLTRPALVLFDEDPYVNFDGLMQFVAANEQWRATRIDGTNGLPHWEKPMQTVAAIDRFWQLPAQQIDG